MPPPPQKAVDPLALPVAPRPPKTKADKEKKRLIVVIEGATLEVVKAGKDYQVHCLLVALPLPLTGLSLNFHCFSSSSTAMTTSTSSASSAAISRSAGAQP